MPINKIIDPDTGEILGLVWSDELAMNLLEEGFHLSFIDTEDIIRLIEAIGG